MVRFGIPQIDSQIAAPSSIIEEVNYANPNHFDGRAIGILDRCFPTEQRLQLPGELFRYRDHLRRILLRLRYRERSNSAVYNQTLYCDLQTVQRGRLARESNVFPLLGITGMFVDGQSRS
jgi:hypothetical protein